MEPKSGEKTLVFVLLFIQCLHEVPAWSNCCSEATGQ